MFDYLDRALRVFGQYYEKQKNKEDIVDKMEVFVKNAKNSARNNKDKRFILINIQNETVITKEVSGGIPIPRNLFHTEIMYMVLLLRDETIKPTKYGIISTKNSCKNCSKIMKKWKDRTANVNRKVFLSIGGLGMTTNDLREYGQNLHIATQYLGDDNKYGQIVVGGDERKYLLKVEDIKDEKSEQYTQVFHLINYYRMREDEDNNFKKKYECWRINKSDPNKPDVVFSSVCPLDGVLIQNNNRNVDKFNGLINKYAYKTLLGAHRNVKYDDKGYADAQLYKFCLQQTLVGVGEVQERFCTPGDNDLQYTIGYDSILGKILNG